MTQRERQTSSAVSDAGKPASGHPGMPRPNVTGEGQDRPPLWDEAYHHASPAQQSELLTLSGRQGVVYAHQLPANGAATDRPRQFLARLVAGKAEELEPVIPTPPDFVDAALDIHQREAVARALATSDICLIQGLPGTGKSRVVAEIVTQAARRGERVLLLGSTSAPVDRVLEQVAGRTEVCAVRCLEQAERIDTLPPAVRELSVAERCRRFRETAIPAAQREVEVVEQRRDRRCQDEATLRPCVELAESWARLEEQATAIQKERESVPAQVEHDAEATGNIASDLAMSLAAAARLRQEALDKVRAAKTVLDQRGQEHRRERDGLIPQRDALRPLGEAKEQGRWWTGVWWQATLAGNVSTRLTELDARLQEIDKALAALDDEQRQQDEEEARAEESFQQERRRLVEAESARRIANLDAQSAALEQDRKLLQEKWEVRCRDLSAETARPTGFTAEAVRIALEALQRQNEQDEQHLAFAREWAAGLQAQADTFASRLVEHANLVAGTTTAVAADEHFGDRTGISFDLLVLEEVHLLTESDFLTAARRARRWVLVGEPELENSVASESRAARSRSFPARPVVVAPRFFQRLWQWLHFDPRTLPYAWLPEGDRLCCRLRPLSAEQRQWLEAERLADFPDIELRILVPPRGRPVLAEVVFPPSMSIYQAKEYIFRELQELPVRACSRSLRWEEGPDRLLLRMGEGDAGEAVAVDLGAGVREMVAGTGGNGNPDPAAWYTGWLEFDRKAGWKRPQAEEWVRRHIGARDLGRTTRLEVPHRMHPDLATVLSHWLFSGAYEISTQESPALDGPPVQFVPVPPTTGENGTGKADNGRRNRPVKGGAGLELDLSDPRHRDRLPAEFRPELPAQGLVNFLEAQAVVRTLEKLAASCNGSKPSVAVLALYPAQAELIRSLIRRVPTLVSCGLDILVDVPEAFRERESSIALVSLTRSHHHRAVAFGKGPHLLTLGLTRARSRVVLFGDPGTLARRVQWEGAVDHLDETGAARERELLSHLVRYFHSGGDSPPAVPVHEGSRS